MLRAFLRRKLTEFEARVIDRLVANESFLDGVRAGHVVAPEHEGVPAISNVDLLRDGGGVVIALYGPHGRSAGLLSPMLAAQLGRMLSIEAARAAVPSDDEEFTPPHVARADGSNGVQGKIDPSLDKVSRCKQCGARWAWLPSASGLPRPPRQCANCEASIASEDRN